ncbi:MAG: glycogen debranching protein GlgX [Myxococcaceae bacterium]|nr:glycogen debranching protein GlgX [Myxococcaceae bacterium]
MTARFEVRPGVPYPLGATDDGHGVNFAFASEHATGVVVCLYDPHDPTRETQRLTLRDVTNHVWHGYVPGLKSGALYGLRVEGPWAPEKGHRFNPQKLLVDPYARAITGKPVKGGPFKGHTVDGKRQIPDVRDSAAFAPKAVVVDDAFDWSGEVRPQVLWRKTILYEVHVKGFTAKHPKVPKALRGTYAGLAHPAAIEHLTSLGVTSVQLLPVHEAVSEEFLVEKGLTNYWGYNTLGFFAPDQRFSSSGTTGGQVREFKAMVKALHQAGLEVILDVVYNHTCEGTENGPTLSLRGLDNATAYWLDQADPSRYRDFTGCGNSLRLRTPWVLKLVMDSLRYWVSEMHVDGFRFDLAPVLGRRWDGEFDHHAHFFHAVHQDPVLSRVKLIAEPWDLGPNGHRIAQFPQLWAEWNDKYRDGVRRFWRGDAGQVGDLGYRLTGSSDLFKPSGRRPTASINFVTCHDGFTLRDLVSYTRKHNEANQEDNRDGTGDNTSTNGGVEGETKDAAVNALRDRQQRNFLATLFLSVGTPMLCAGDEFGKTQGGNNNAYCQDSELSYLDWKLDAPRAQLLEYAKAVIHFRQSQEVLQRRNFFLGETLDDSRFRDLVWFRPDGKEMGPGDWGEAERRALGWFLGGDAITSRTPDGTRVMGDSLLLWMNAAATPLDVTLPQASWGESWEVALETIQTPGRAAVYPAGAVVQVPARAVLVLRTARPGA